MEKTKWLRLYMSCKRCSVPVLYKYRTICEHCREAYYCSIECYYKDKISHKKDCKGIGLEASRSSNIGPDISKVTLREKWIIRISGASEEPIKIFICCYCEKKCVERLGLPCYKCGGVYYCSEDCLEKDGPDHSLRCETIALFHCVDDILYHVQTFESLKKKGFSGSLEFSPFLDSLVHELAPTMFTDVKFERAAIILQIVSPYPHSWRFATLARDVRGAKTHIIFHDEQKTGASMTGGPNVEPYSVATVPLGNCLKPGNFIILLDPWFHTFKDFTMGVRIDSVDKVHFVWKD